MIIKFEKVDKIPERYRPSEVCDAPGCDAPTPSGAMCCSKACVRVVFDLLYSEVTNDQ